MILLFDVDGVLVENCAYREGIRRTAAYFCERLGVSPVKPTDADIDIYEAQSITVEWETCAMLAAAVLLERLHADLAAPRRREAVLSLSADLWEALGQLPRLRQPITTEVDVPGLARRVGEAQQRAARADAGHRAELPSRVALRLFQADLEQQDPILRQKALPLLEHLLGDLYDQDRSPAAQVFQNIILGDAQYERYYQRPPVVRGENLLEKLDRPLLGRAMRDAVLARRAAGAAHPVLYTARPSLAPVEAGGFHRAFTPESEIARDLVGLEGVPVMGLGKVDWYAQRLGARGDAWVKPSPVHSMAAMAAARTGQEVEAIKAAVAVERGDHLRYPLTACAGETVHVFEDSPSSLRAVARAVELLNRQGLGLRLRCLGITGASSAKRETLAEAADEVHPDINTALASVFDG
jgi:hypothetical protein